MQNSNSQQTASFVEAVCGDDAFRVEKDLGDGFVKLRSSEAEKRQAAQDIRSSEDIIIELLRNSRDADAKNIFIGIQKDLNKRLITVIDDGSGVPTNMQKRIFEPRVTSKLNTAHLDKWGMHGRGMALYSVSTNSDTARIAFSEVGYGTSIAIETNTDVLGEKKDQSTFPRFEESDGVLSMRGPKNIVRTVAEFSLEHRELNVYCGTFTEIAATLYEMGVATVPSATRIFKENRKTSKLIEWLAFCNSPEELAATSDELGFPISARSARRIMDGNIPPLDTMLDLVRQRSFANDGSTTSHESKKKKPTKKARIKVDESDISTFTKTIDEAFEELAETYFLSKSGTTQVRIDGESLKVEIPFERIR